MTTRNLIFTSAGDKANCMNWWSGQESSDYAICVYYYGNSEERYAMYKEHANYIQRSKGSKFQNFYKFWIEFPNLIKEYDRFFILDDDIEIKVSDINEMFKMSEEHSLLICQPSFSDRSKISHTITKHKRNTILTYTNFIEINCPLFTREAITNLMNVFDPILEEWGVDILSMIVNGLEKQMSYAIIHKIQCTNPLDRKGREIDLLHSEEYRIQKWKEYVSKNSLNYPRQDTKYNMNSLALVEHKHIYMPSKILVVVVSCKKNIHLWKEIKERNCELLILCGGSDTTHLDSDILYLKCDDSYEGLPEKMICAIDFILKCSKYNSITHILKVDDHDTVFSKDTIDTISIKYNDILHSKDYIGQKVWNKGNYKHHYGKVSKFSYWDNRPFKGPVVPFVDGGSSYILSRYSMTCINKSFHIYNLNFLRYTYILEDVMIGILLKAYNISPYELNYGIKYNQEGILSIDTPIRILTLVISWKGNSHIWPSILDRNIDDLLIVCGGSDISHLNSKILHLKCDDSYEGLPEKILCAIDFIVNCSEFDSITHILKVDDHDTQFTASTLQAIQTKHSGILLSNNYIGQHVLDTVDTTYHFKNTSIRSPWKTKEYSGPISIYCDGGKSYILSRFAMNCINTTFSTQSITYIRYNHIYEDLMIGIIMKSYNITPYELNYGIQSVSYLRETIHKTIPSVKEAGWIHIGYEREHFSLPIGSHIRFGKDTTWIEKITYGETFKGDRRFFGGDPVKCVVKDIQFNLYSKIERDSWIRIGYEDNTILIPRKARLSFGNDTEGWIEKEVAASSFLASKGFFGSTKSYNHRNIIRILIKGTQ